MDAEASEAQGLIGTITPDGCWNRSADQRSLGGAGISDTDKSIAEPLEACMTLLDRPRRCKGLPMSR